MRGLWCANTHNLVLVLWQWSITNYLTSGKVREVGTCMCVCGLSTMVAFNEPHISYQAWCSTNALIRPHGGLGLTDRVWCPPHPPHPNPLHTILANTLINLPLPCLPPLPSVLLSERNILERNCESKGFFILFHKEKGAMERDRDGVRDSTGQKKDRKWARDGWREGKRWREWEKKTKDKKTELLWAGGRSRGHVLD